MDPKEKTVWITGASSGIGAALAVEMARTGAKLILSARREDRLAEVRTACLEHSPDVAVLPLDVGDAEALPAAVEAAESHYGPIDMLVCNAGIGQRGRAAETALEVDRRILDINYFGAVALAKTVLPGMRSRRNGQIVVTSSVLGKMGVPTRSAYCASKHALHGFFDALRAEVHADNVAVTLICPGYIRTEIGVHALEADGSEHGKVDPGQLKGMTAEACARRMMRPIRRGAAEAVIGGWVETAGVLLKRWCPALFNWVIRRMDVN